MGHTLFHWPFNEKVLTVDLPWSDVEPVCLQLSFLSSSLMTCQSHFHFWFSSKCHPSTFSPLSIYSCLSLWTLSSKFLQYSLPLLEEVNEEDMAWVNLQPWPRQSEFPLWDSCTFLASLLELAKDNLERAMSYWDYLDGICDWDQFRTLCTILRFWH